MLHTFSRRARWLAVGLVGASLVLPATILAAGPGSGDFLPNSGHTSNTDGLTPTMIANATISCDASNSVGQVSGQFTLNGTGAPGTYVVIYLTPNNGSNASPAGNVENNEVTVPIAGLSGTVSFSLPVTSAFTTSTGGILAVFAKDADGSTFTSKSNSLNCSESTATPTPEATPTPVATPVATPTPEATPTPAPVATPTPEATPTPAPVATPTPEATPTPAPVATQHAGPTPTPQATPTGGVDAATATPRITPPSTDTVRGGQPGASGSGLGAVLLFLGALALGGALLRPGSQRIRR